MITILFRTLIIYFTLTATMRLMGKRQIGELEVTDLVTTLLLSEIASLPITDQAIPLSHAILPMIVLLILEVVSSLILVYAPRLRRLVSAEPTVIIHNGKLCQRALRDLRISMEELMSEVRQQGLTDLSQIDSAILEKNGKLTVLPKPAHQPPTAQQLGLSVSDSGLMHVVYRNGYVSKIGLELIDKDKSWLQNQLCKQGHTLDSLLCVMANREGKLLCIKKEGKHKK